MTSPAPGAPRRRPSGATDPLTYLRVSRDAVRDVARWRRGEPSSAGTYLALRTLHRHTAGASSRVAMTALRLVPGTPDRGRSPVATLDQSWRPAATALRRDGITYLPPVIDADAVARLEAFARTAPATVRLADGQPARGTYEQRPDGARAVYVREDFVLANPDVQHLLANARVWEFARRHFGAGAVVQPPSLYWSCGGHNDNPDLDLILARRYHWDYDGLRGLRLQLYLTDVDELSAPMRYVAGSHRVGAYRSRALRRADRGVATDEVWRVFDPAAERTMTGPAGTVFISESCGLHSGSDPVSRDRLFLVMAVQGTGFAGYHLRQRSVVPRDEAFAAALAAGRPELRMFRAKG